MIKRQNNNQREVQTNQEVSKMETVIGSTAVITGDIQTKDGLRVEGVIKGSITSSSEVVVASSGSVEGNIHSNSATIAGVIQGNLTVQGRTTFEASSQLKGDLKTKSLVIAEGAAINGQCTMTSSQPSNSNTSSNSPKSAPKKEAVAG